MAKPGLDGRRDVAENQEQFARTPAANVAKILGQARVDMMIDDGGGILPGRVDFSGGIALIGVAQAVHEMAHHHALAVNGRRDLRVDEDARAHLFL